MVLRQKAHMHTYNAILTTLPKLFTKVRKRFSSKPEKFFENQSLFLKKFLSESFPGHVEYIFYKPTEFFFENPKSFCWKFENKIKDNNLSQTLCLPSKKSSGQEKYVLENSAKNFRQRSEKLLLKVQKELRK